MKLRKIIPLDTKAEVVFRQLRQWEDAEEAIVQLKTRYKSTFDLLEQFEKLKQEALDTIKRTLYTAEGPPPEAAGKTTHLWAKSATFNVSVQYKRRSFYYDPKKLPRELLIPEIITEIDKDKLEALVGDDPSRRMQIDAARVEGAWQTPAVSIARNK